MFPHNHFGFTNIANWNLPCYSQYPMHIQYDPQHRGVPQYNRQQPTIDSTIFIESASAGLNLLRDANEILYRISNDQTFANQLMVAARQSDFNQVDHLITSIGVTRKVETWFNPDGIRIEIASEEGLTGESRLILSLRWQVFSQYV